MQSSRGITSQDINTDGRFFPHLFGTNGQLFQQMLSVFVARWCFLLGVRSQFSEQECGNTVPKASIVTVCALKPGLQV